MKKLFESPGKILLVLIATIVVGIVIGRSTKNIVHKKKEVVPNYEKAEADSKNPLMGYYNEVKSAENKDSGTQKATKTITYTHEDSATLKEIKNKNEATIKTLISQCDFSNFEGITNENELGEKYSHFQTLAAMVWSYGQDSKELKHKFDRLQERLFPYFRKKLGEIINEKLWINDGAAKTLGSRNQILRFTSAEFAANRNIQDSYNAIIDVLKKYRFKKVEFLWYQYDDNYTYYNIPSLKDNDSVN